MATPPRPPHSEPCYVRVKVQPNARKERILKAGDRYEINVKERAQAGQATKRTRELLAEVFGCRPKDLTLVAGATSQTKTFLLGNIHHHEDKH